jgi:hypothetical protein
MNNASMQTADRATHLKVVVVALVASIAVTVVAISARTSPETVRLEASAPVIKAGKPVAVTSDESKTIR